MSTEMHSPRAQCPVYIAGFASTASLSSLLCLSIALVLLPPCPVPTPCSRADEPSSALSTPAPQVPQLCWLSCPSCDARSCLCKVHAPAHPCHAPAAHIVALLACRTSPTCAMPGADRWLCEHHCCQCTAVQHMRSLIPMPSASGPCLCPYAPSSAHVLLPLSSLSMLCHVILV